MDYSGKDLDRKPVKVTEHSQDESTFQGAA